MNKRIEDILKSISSDVLTEEVKTSIADTFNTTVNEKVESQVQIVVENELGKMDADHMAKLQKLVEAIDEDHTAKFKVVVEKIDAAHTAKLQKIIEKYENELKEGADKLRGELISKMSNYLDLYLAETIPDTQLKEAVENIRARKMLAEIKKIVAIDPEFISENFKEALKDGHDTIEKLREDLNSKIKESVDINQQLVNTKAQLVMEQKTRDLPEEKKAFISKLLEGKKPEEIEANFQFVLEMYEREEVEKTAVITESAKNKSQTFTQKIDAPKSTIIESVDQTQVEETSVDGYLAELKKV